MDFTLKQALAVLVVLVCTAAVVLWLNSSTSSTKSHVTSADTFLDMSVNSKIKSLLAGDEDITDPGSSTDGSSTSSDLPDTYIAPTIKTNPTSKTVNDGEVIKFSIEAEGSDLKYQWYKNGQALSNATNSSYQTPELSSSDDGNAYFCIVSNKRAKVTSDTVLANVLYAPRIISSSPTVDTVPYGSEVQMFVVATHGNPVSTTYQWYKADDSSDPGTAISGATNSVYDVTVTENAKYYYCRISNENYTVKSSYFEVLEGFYVTFLDDNGTQLSKQLIGYGMDATVPTIPAKEGYTASWSQNASNIRESRTIKLSYTANDYTLLVYNNDIIGSVDSYTMKATDTLSSISTPQKDGYTFTGWFNSEGKQVSLSSTFGSLFGYNDGAIYAHFKATQHTLKIYVDNNLVDTKTVSSDQAISDYVSGIDTVKKGYEFRFWAFSNNGYDMIDTGLTYQTLFGDSDGSIYTSYSPIYYSIVFDSNSSDAIGSMNTLELQYDEEGTIPAPNYSREGYEVYEWNTKSDGSGTSYSSSASSPQTVKNLTATNGETITLYAMWKAKICKLTYYNAATNAIMFVQYYSPDAIISLINYETDFGWYTSQSGGQLIARNDLIYKNIFGYGDGALYYRAK